MIRTKVNKRMKRRDLLFIACKLSSVMIIIIIIIIIGRLFVSDSPKKLQNEHYTQQQCYIINIILSFMFFL